MERGWRVWSGGEQIWGGVVEWEEQGDDWKGEETGSKGKEKGGNVQQEGIVKWEYWKERRGSRKSGGSMGGVGEWEVQNSA